MIRHHCSLGLLTINRLIDPGRRIEYNFFGSINRKLKFKMAVAAILNIGFLTLTHRLIFRFRRNFVRRSTMACRRGPHDKNCKFLKPRWRTAAILKIVKSPYLSEKLSDFDEIQYTTANGEPDRSHVTKNLNLKFTSLYHVTFV